MLVENPLGTIIFRAGLAALAALAAALHAIAAAPMQTTSEAAGEEIVVTGTRLQPIKVDYRLRGALMTACIPRDAQQDRDAVAAICDLIQDCALKGRRAKPELSACVADRLARKHRRDP
ncbi:hypothetical protein ATB93_13655 [Sphingomonas sp. WG]|nr:hypothetical protein ATB93_13655 [Sphingomonas sp. WG]